MLAKIYQAPLYRGLDKLETLWPLLVGGAMLAAIDIGFGLAEPARRALLVILLGPGALWALYLTYHELRSLPERWRRHGTLSDADEDQA